MPEANIVKSKREELRDAARARRLEAARRRNAFVELIVTGFSYAEVAEQFQMTANAVRHIVNKEIARRRLDAPEHYVRLQVARLNKGMMVVEKGLARDNLGAVDRLLKVVAHLDRYHLGAPSRAPAPPARAIAAPAPAPLALTHAAPPMAPIDACAEKTHSSDWNS